MNPTNYTFADETLLMVRETLKTAFYVSDWPFESVRNELVVSLAGLYHDGQITNCDVINKTDSGNNLHWLAVNVDGKTLYAQMLEVRNFLSFLFFYK